MDGSHSVGPPNGVPPLHPRPPPHFNEPSTSKPVNLEPNAVLFLQTELVRLYFGGPVREQGNMRWMQRKFYAPRHLQWRCRHQAHACSGSRCACRHWRMQSPWSKLLPGMRVHGRWVRLHHNLALIGTLNININLFLNLEPK